MLVKAVMDAGYSKRLAEKAVDGVIMAWKRALAAHKPVELPIGTLKVKKTPKNLFKKRYGRRLARRDGRVMLHTWTTYNDPYRVLWRMNKEEWLQLLKFLNPGMTDEQLNEPYVPNPKNGRRSLRQRSQEPAVQPRDPQPIRLAPVPISLVPRHPTVPSRTAPFKRR
jgi:hypothetical protein